MLNALGLSRFLIALALSSSLLLPQQANFKPKPAQPPPPGGSITGKTVNAKVGAEVQGPIATVSLCGDQPFVAMDTDLDWETASGWETGYLYGPQNREVFGRHTYKTAGNYTVAIRIQVRCEGTYSGYYDAAKGTATIIVN